MCRLDLYHSGHIQRKFGQSIRPALEVGSVALCHGKGPMALQGTSNRTP